MLSAEIAAGGALRRWQRHEALRDGFAASFRGRPNKHIDQIGHKGDSGRDADEATNDPCVTHFCPRLQHGSIWIVKKPHALLSPSPYQVNQSIYSYEAKRAYLYEWPLPRDYLLPVVDHKMESRLGVF